MLITFDVCFVIKTKNLLMLLLLFVSGNKTAIGLNAQFYASAVAVYGGGFGNMSGDFITSSYFGGGGGSGYAGGWLRSDGCCCWPVGRRSF